MSGTLHRITWFGGGCDDGWGATHPANVRHVQVHPIKRVLAFIFFWLIGTSFGTSALLSQRRGTVQLFRKQEIMAFGRVESRSSYIATQPLAARITNYHLSVTNSLVSPS